MSHVSRMPFTFKSILACTAMGQANIKFRNPKKNRIGRSKFARIKGSTSTLRQAGTECLTRCAKKGAKAIQLTRWKSKWACNCYSDKKSKKSDTKYQSHKTQTMVARKIQCQSAGKHTFPSSMLPVYL